MHQISGSDVTWPTATTINGLALRLGSGVGGRMADFQVGGWGRTITVEAMRQQPQNNSFLFPEC